MYENDRIIKQNSNKTKHNDIKYHVNKHLKKEEIIELCYCLKKLMIAYILAQPKSKSQI